MVKPTRYARFYRTLRPSDLEYVGPEVVTFYRDESYEFAQLNTSQWEVENVGIFRMFLKVLRLPQGIVEVNEPLMIRGWIVSVPVAVANLIRGKRRHTLVSYAIENFDPSFVLSAKARVPRPLSRVIVRQGGNFLISQLNRLAFGTTGSAELYLEHLTGMRARSASQSRTFSSLTPGQTRPTNIAARVPRSALFVGTFDERKGILPLLEAWRIVREREPSATLEIYGQGPLAERVNKLAAEIGNVCVSQAAARTEVLDAYWRAKTCILLSQPHKNWREQIGLPLLEALERGCNVICTTESGIAQEVVALGQICVQPNIAPGALADQILLSFSLEEVTPALLPSSNGRAVAQQWLVEGGEID